MKLALPKLEMQQLVVFILLLVIAGIAGMIGLNIQDNIGDSLAECSTGLTYNETGNECYNVSNRSVPTPAPPGNLEYNASVSSKQGISNLTSQFPNIGLVVAAVVIISLLVAGFAFAFRGGGGF